MTDTTSGAPAADPNTPAAGAPAADPAPAPVIDPKLSAEPAPANPQAAAADPAGEAETVSYDKTGDVGLDMALDFVGKLGIKSDHPAMAATATGDFSLIKAHLASMGDKAQGWEQFVALAEASYTRQTQEAETQAKAISAAVVAVAGTPEAWAAIKDWASKNATADEKSAINAMFDAGPVQARAAAIMLRDLHAKAAGTTVNPKSAVRKDASADTVTTGALNQREYAAEVRKLHAKLGTRMEQSQEYAALRQRFAQSR